MKFKSIQFSVAALAGAIVLSVVAALVVYALQALLASEPAALRERVLANMVNDPKLNGPECLTPG